MLSDKERFFERLELLMTNSLHQRLIAFPICGWCYGTGRASRPGKLFGRHLFDKGKCKWCAGTGEADGGKWNLRRLAEELTR